MAQDGRQLALQRIVDQLGNARIGQRYGLARIVSFEDFRASVPIHDRTTHESEIDALIGFGVADEQGAQGALSASADIERPRVVDAWLYHLKGYKTRRIALLRNDGGDVRGQRILREDLLSLGGEILHIANVDELEPLRSRLSDFSPDLVALRSAMLLPLLRQAQQPSLIDGFSELRAGLCEFDHRAARHTGVPTFSSGWFFAGERVGLPSPSNPQDALTLAIGSSLIELLPYSNPEEDGRRIYADRTTLPEHAIVGSRYEVVLSSVSGLLRLRTEEHVRVVGFDPPTPEAPHPRARVVRLSPPPADVALEGCTVAGSWLTASVRQALWREDPVLASAEVCADPRSVTGITGTASASRMHRDAEIFGETELGTATTRLGMRRGDLPRRPRGLLCRIEVQGFVQRDLAARVADRIDQSLRRRSPAYAWLRERDELLAPRILIVPQGTRARDQTRRLYALRGPVLQPQVRIVDV